MGHIWDGTYLALITCILCWDIFGSGTYLAPINILYDGTYLGRDIFGLNYFHYMMGHIWDGTYLALITFIICWDIFGSGT